MDYLWQIHFQYSWVGLFGLMIKLALLYFFLQIARQGSIRIAAPSPWQLKLKKIIHYALLIFEPVALLILSSYFVLIHPFYHGLIILFLVLTNLRHLRNYFSGRIVLFDTSMHIGNRISSGKQSNSSTYIKGVITRIGRLGIRVQTDKGFHFITYNKLLQQSYSLLDRNEKGGFFKLKIGLNSEADQASAHQQLIDLFNVSPYINWQHQPEIKQIDRQHKNQWRAHIALHHEQHLDDLMDLLEERGFSCQIAKIKHSL